MEEKKQKKNPMVKIATFIVDKRNLFFLIYIVVIGEVLLNSLGGLFL